ncbi:hypothetical protein, partial [Clostridium sp. AF12-41]|uniref:hypothetical protein n=1 Tax=Clostridium sp. AF12-41 TaxID=2292994 RepID=UPI001A9A56BE
FDDRGYFMPFSTCCASKNHINLLHSISYYRQNISDIQGEGDALFAVAGNTAPGYRKLDSIE